MMEFDPRVKEEEEELECILYSVGILRQQREDERMMNAAAELY